MSPVPIEFAVPLLVFGLKGAGAVRRLVKNGRLLRAWQEVAGACGLRVVETSRWSPRLTAGAGPVTVTIDSNGIGVRGPMLPDFYHVRIRREPLVHRTGEIEIGDDSFDKKFWIEGPMRQVLALLDAETRRLMVLVNNESWLEISFGTLRAQQMDDERVAYVLPLLLDIGRRLAGLTDLPRRLADNARGDPEAGVRRQNLLVLVRELPEAPETLEALRAACSDPSPEIRLQAAKGLGAEGRDLLLDLAESLVDDGVSADAVATLDRELSFERTKAILDHALDRRLTKTARACLEALGRSGAAAAAEPPLLLALQREEADLRIAAATALGRVGSAAAVLPLKEATERSWLDRELHRAAHQAVTEIQARLQGALPGQLSLTQADAGHLSIAVEPAGQLSLPPEEPGQTPPRAREGPAVRRV